MASPQRNRRLPYEKNGILVTDLCVIGGGSGGLSVTAGAAQMGASVVLVEKGAMGGECLNTGCIPSKALIASARVAHTFNDSLSFGVDVKECAINYARVHAHLRSVIQAIAPHDSVERFESLGVRVITEAATFISPSLLRAGATTIAARRFVIATGSRAAVPSIAGLADVPFFTNENIFDLTEQPHHLVVIGGGSVGVELAQAFCRLGSKVTLLERATLLANEEPEAVHSVKTALRHDGVRIYENVAISSVATDPSGIAVSLEGAADAIIGSHLLVATGRVPDVTALALEKAGIAATARGISVDARMRTSNARVFAIGDVAGGPQFTHAANYQAGIVLRNALFGLRAKVDYRALPRVIYSDPEIAHVGLTEAAARQAGHDVQVLSLPLSSIDRAQAERRTDGLAKIVLGRRGRILGATLVCRNAGELIALWSLAIARNLPVRTIAQLTMPYPTLSELSKRVAGSYYLPSLFGPRVQALVRLIQRFVP
jgi:pyruvate/2-oxoglutarate dehydrogenase complex dihydrolipoamide dehydrogenase (E3) component